MVGLVIYLVPAISLAPHAILLHVRPLIDHGQQPMKMPTASTLLYNDKQRYEIEKEPIRIEMTNLKCYNTINKYLY